MFIRRTTYRLAPGYDSVEGQAEFEREMRSRIHPMTGLVSSTHVMNANGTWTIIAVWLSETQAQAGLARIRAAFDSQSDKLAGPPKVEHYDVVVKEYL